MKTDQNSALQATRSRRAPVAILVVAGLCVAAMISTAASAVAAGSYNNAEIATRALRYVGQWGGNACRDAHKPGDSGGQCRAFVNCIVWMASNHTQNLGGRDYYQPFLTAGGQRITNISQLEEGDIVQVGEGVHTFIIVRKLSVNAAGVGIFTVVDSNHEYNERVMTYNRTFSLSSTTRAYRMGSLPQPSGSAPAAPSPPPTAAPEPVAPVPPSTPSPPAPLPSPPAPPTYLETPGGGVHTWTNYSDAGGAEGPSIPSNISIAIACKVTGFVVADGDSWWYRIAASPWDGNYYGSADAFYNNGQTTGSLLGTPFVDAGIPNC
jgi:hypothetical protein